MPLSTHLKRWAREKAQEVLDEVGIRGSHTPVIDGPSSTTSRPSTTTTGPTISATPIGQPTNPSMVPGGSSTHQNSVTTATSPPSATTGQPSFDGCRWNVPGVGKFDNMKVYNFFDSSLPEGLDATNETIYDSYDNENTNWNHRFTPDNVYSDGDFLNLVVPATTNPPESYQDQAIPCAQITTHEDNILYGSVRINAIFSDVPGICHGLFFYKDDTQETDIEYLTDPNSAGNNVNQTSSNGDPIPLWYSNQSLRPPAPATQQIGPAPWDVTAVHEYRIDWTKSFTAFYLDGVLQKTFTTNVPNKPSYFIINNWSNGDINWSAGPPKQDNVMKIQNITMYYNTTKSSLNC